MVWRLESGAKHHRLFQFPFVYLLLIYLNVRADKPIRARVPVTGVRIFVAVSRAIYHISFRCVKCGRRSCVRVQNVFQWRRLVSNRTRINSCTAVGIYRSHKSLITAVVVQLKKAGQKHWSHEEIKKNRKLKRIAHKVGLKFHRTRIIYAMGNALWEKGNVGITDIFVVFAKEQYFNQLIAGGLQNVRFEYIWLSLCPSETELRKASPRTYLMNGFLSLLGSFALWMAAQHDFLILNPTWKEDAWAGLHQLLRSF